MRIKKGDNVQIVRGKDKGKTGKVQQVFPGESKVLVEGMNQYKRHLKARSQTQPAEIVTITKPLPVASMQVVCPKCKQITRIGITRNAKERSRICRKCGGIL